MIGIEKVYAFDYLLYGQRPVRGKSEAGGLGRGRLRAEWSEK